MRFYLIPIFFIIFGLNFGYGQRFGYIDTDFILNKMPDYKKAQDEINQLSTLWEKEIQGMAKDIEAMYASLQAEQVLLTEEMRKERTEAIKKKESDLKEYQKKVFGFGGLFFLKKQELIKPVQDKVWDAVDPGCRRSRAASGSPLCARGVPDGARRARTVLRAPRARIRPAASGRGRRGAGARTPSPRRTVGNAAG
jgi:outer membrane protein